MTELTSNFSSQASPVNVNPSLIEEFLPLNYFIKEGEGQGGFVKNFLKIIFTNPSSSPFFKGKNSSVEFEVTLMQISSATSDLSLKEMTRLGLYLITQNDPFYFPEIQNRNDAIKNYNLILSLQYELDATFKNYREKSNLKSNQFASAANNKTESKNYLYTCNDCKINFISYRLDTKKFSEILFGHKVNTLRSAHSVTSKEQNINSKIIIHRANNYFNVKSFCEKSVAHSICSALLNAQSCRVDRAQRKVVGWTERSVSTKRRIL